VKICVCVLPDGWRAATVSGGEPLSISGVSLALGNTFNRGTNITLALMHATAVIRYLFLPKTVWRLLSLTLRTTILVPSTVEILISLLTYHISLSAILI
jgi:hypothetical protein